MTKSLLLGLLAMGSALSASAWEANEYVYTNEGRFQITNSANLYSGDFSNFTGWNPISASADKTCADLFTNTNGTVNSVSGTATEGMYYTLTGLPVGSSCVVSFKIRQHSDTGVGVWPYSTNVRVDATSAEPESLNTFGCTDANKNYINLVGNKGAVYNSAIDYTSYGNAIELTNDYQTVSFAIPTVDGEEFYYLVIKGINPTVEICDVTIQEAIQVADLRIRDQKIEETNAFKKCFNWTEEQLEGINENLENLNSITDASTQEEMQEFVDGMTDALNEFKSENMENFLSTCKSGTDWNTITSKAQKLSSIGDWTLSNARWFHCNSNDADTREATKYYITGPSYGYGLALGDQYCKMTKALNPGGYVFSVQGLANTCYNKAANTGGSGYTANEGLDEGYMTLYFMTEAGDTIASKLYALEADKYKTGIISVNIQTAGNYEIGVKLSQPETTYKPTLTLGGSYYLAYPELYNHNAGYSAAQLAYETNVRTQISAGRTALTLAADYIANNDYKWGKDELKACVDTTEAKIAEYEKLDQDAIIATMPESYVSGLTDPSVSGLEATVYIEAAKGILAANKAFLAKNDTLSSLATAIANAQKIIALRIYDAATGKADLQAEISKAESLLADMMAAEYSVENAAAIVKENEALSAAVNVFVTTVPASAITDVVDIDFSNAAVVDDADAAALPAGSTATVAGNVGTMSFTNFTTVTPTSGTDMPFELGIDANGAKDSIGVLRVGNGSATVGDIALGDMGTNIIKVAMDWWFLRLSAGYVGFYLKNENDSTIAGIYFDPYEQATASLYDPCGIQDGKSSYFVANTSGDAASCVDANKTHMELVLDYGTKTMYMQTTTPSATFTTDPVAFGGDNFTSFVLTSNYKTFYGRRCWFDNLKIQKYQAGEPTAISEVSASAAKVNNGVLYNIAGQQVSKNYKGIVVRNGHKFMNK